MSAVAQTNENAPLLFRCRGVKVDVSDVLSALRQSSRARIKSAIPQPCGDSTQSLPLLPSANAIRFDTAYQSHGIVHSSAVFVSVLTQGLESGRVCARRIVRMDSDRNRRPTAKRNDRRSGFAREQSPLRWSWVPFAHSLTRVR